MTTKTVTNGEVWLDGKLYLMCGDNPVPIRKLDSKGVVVPKDKDDE